MDKTRRGHYEGFHCTLNYIWCGFLEHTTYHKWEQAYRFVNKQRTCPHTLAVRQRNKHLNAYICGTFSSFALEAKSCASCTGRVKIRAEMANSKALNSLQY